MLKLIGAIFVIVAGSILGATEAMRLSARVRSLTSIVSSLEIMRSEICDRLTPLPELMEILAKTGPSPAKSFFANCLQELQSLGIHSFFEIWKRAAKATYQLELRPNEFLAFCEIGLPLGKYDIEEQRAGLDAAISRMTEFRRKAEEERKSYGKVYAALGVTAGIFTVIILL